MKMISFSLHIRFPRFCSPIVHFSQGTLQETRKPFYAAVSKERREWIHIRFVIITSNNKFGWQTKLDDTKFKYKFVIKIIISEKYREVFQKLLLLKPYTLPPPCENQFDKIIKLVVTKEVSH